MDKCKKEVCCCAELMLAQRRVEELELELKKTKDWPKRYLDALREEKLRALGVEDDCQEA